TTEVLADGIYLFRAPAALDFWTATNVVAIVNESDVTVFDTATRPSTARAIVAELRRRTAKPVRTIVNSHWHMDHWCGNDEFLKAFPGAQIIATSATRDYMTRTTAAFFADGIDRRVASARANGAPERDIAEAMRFADEMRAVPHVLPTLVFRDTL